MAYMSAATVELTRSGDEIGRSTVTGWGDWVIIFSIASDTESIGYGDSRYLCVGPADGSFDCGGRSDGLVCALGI